MLTESIALIGVGFTLGLLHALDADHVMAVSALSARKPSLLRTLRFSANWALGHGGVLLVSGALLFGLGLSIPQSLQVLAEASVGVLLMVLGVWCFWGMRKQSITLEKHSHGDIEHIHWRSHEHGSSREQNHKNGHEQVYSNSRERVFNNSIDKKTFNASEKHTPVMVGVLHGLAGSAPALALIPAVAQGEVWLALAYLVLFSVGVMLSMVAFGLGLGSLQRKLEKSSAKLFQFTRYLIATTSVILGAVWLNQAI